MQNGESVDSGQAPPAGAGLRDPALLAPLPVEVSLMAQDGRYVMFDNSGRKLYFYDRDPPGESTCYGECAENWEPVTAEGGADRVVGDWSVLVRQDGSHQWLYKGKPAYVPRGDAVSAGTGDAGEHWHVLSLDRLKSQVALNGALRKPAQQLGKRCGKGK